MENFRTPLKLLVFDSQLPSGIIGIGIGFGMGIGSNYGHSVSIPIPTAIPIAKAVNSGVTCNELEPYLFYFPLYTGFLFSRNAASPSSRSSVGMQTQYALDSMARPVWRSVSIP